MKITFNDTPSPDSPYPCLMCHEKSGLIVLRLDGGTRGVVLKASDDNPVGHYSDTWSWGFAGACGWTRYTGSVTLEND